MNEFSGVPDNAAMELIWIVPVPTMEPVVSVPVVVNPAIVGFVARTTAEPGVPVAIDCLLYTSDAADD